MSMPDLAAFAAIVRQNRFDISISGPGGSLGEGIKAEAVDIPNREIVAETYGEIGLPRKVASSVAFGDISVTFREIGDFSVTGFFTAWMDFICDTGGKANQMEFEYYDNFVGNMQIIIYDGQNNPIGTGEFNEAYPIKIGGIKLAQGNSDYATVTADIAYRGFTFG